MAGRRWRNQSLSHLSMYGPIHSPLRTSARDVQLQRCRSSTCRPPHSHRPCSRSRVLTPTLTELPGGRNGVTSARATASRYRRAIVTLINWHVLQTGSGRHPIWVHPRGKDEEDMNNEQGKRNTDRDKGKGNVKGDCIDLVTKFTSGKIMQHDG